MTKYFIVLSRDGIAAVVTKREEELAGLLEAGGSAAGELFAESDDGARIALAQWATTYMPIQGNNVETVHPRVTELESEIARHRDSVREGMDRDFTDARLWRVLR